MKKKKVISIILAITMLLTLCFCCTGCRESEFVTYNVSKEADNFNVVRRLVVINTVTDKPEFELIGRMSITADTSQNQLEVVVETNEDEYQKHIIGLNQATTMYVVEGIGNVDVNKYQYEINYQPESIVPVEIVDMD